MSGPTSLTRSVAEFVSKLAPGDIPKQAFDIAALGFTDVIGVMIAGTNEPVTRIVEGTVRELGSAGAVSVALSDRHLTAPDAALVNGCAAHALDYDDAGGHRSAVLVPALLAEGEELGSSGEQLAVAYVAGYEAWSELARREKGQLHERGLHPTGIYGAVATAAAIANLRGLTVEHASAALGIAASGANGLVANFGSMTKPFHAGQSARTGVIAARLATHGMTSSRTVFEHPRGFLPAISQHGDYDSESPVRLGREWRIGVEGLSIKKYPTCYCTHRSIDSALALHGEGIDPDAIARIDVHIGKTQKAILHADSPHTALEAKFSIQFAAACALQIGRVSLMEVDDSVVNDPALQRLMSRVQIELTDEYDSLMHQYAPWDRISVVLSTGETRKGPEVKRARGHIENPVSTAELRAKFMECLQYGRSAIDGPRLFSALQDLVYQPAGWIRTHVAPQALLSPHPKQVTL